MGISLSRFRVREILQRSARRGAFLWVLMGALASCCVWSWEAHAQTRAQVDVSVSVGMTPLTFVPGGQGTFTITVHNAGPDAAGTIFPDEKPIRALGSAFIVTAKPPPFELVGISVGNCWLDRWVSEPLPDGNIVVAFDYYFGPIPAGESHSCTSEIYFNPSTTTDIPANWQVIAFNDDDVNPANNRADYVFRLRPVMVPVSSLVGLMFLALGLLALVGHALHVSGDNRR